MGKEPPKLRVRVSEGFKEMSIGGFDLRIASLAKGNGIRTFRSGSTEPGRSFQRLVADSRSSWSLQCLPNGKVKLTIDHKTPTSWIAETPLRIEALSGFLKWGSRTYRDEVWIHTVKEKGETQCEAVNHVGIEKYLDGLVNGEISASWSPATIDSQVIAARTYAYFQAREAAKDKLKHFDLDSSTKDQVYDGSKKEDHRAAKSAERTKGMILVPKGSKQPMKAYYHSTCGGMTELPENVWGKTSPGIKRRVKCDYCKASPSYFWEAKFSDSQILQRLLRVVKGMALPFPQFVSSSQIIRLQTESLPNSERVDTVKIELKDVYRSLSWKLPANKLRLGLDPVQLKSTQFKVFALNGDDFVFRGRGYGHGVGMCQWGAKVMGDQGKRSKDILTTYYPDADLLRAW